MGNLTKPEAILCKAFGEAVREKRLSLAMSQEDLSTETGLHRTYISDIERGKRNISLTTIWHLAEAMKLNLGEMIAKTEGRRTELQGTLGKAVKA